MESGIDSASVQGVCLIEASSIWLEEGDPGEDTSSPGMLATKIALGAVAQMWHRCPAVKHECPAPHCGADRLEWPIRA
jgi:hypothetical protein